MSASQTKHQSGKFVVPGDTLGVIEEFTPGEGTYVDKGMIHAKVSGRTLVDTQNKRVSIYPLVKEAIFPKTGSIVTGQVMKLQSKTAIVRIFQVGKDKLSGVFSGLLYISDVSSSFVDSIHEAMKPGDLVRARVISEKNRTLHLSTADRNLGVLHSLCSRCGHTLERKRYKLSCTYCGSLERRKIALGYGKLDSGDEEEIE